MPAESQEALVALAQRHLAPNYQPQPIVLARGEGSVVWDVAGRRYLDMTAGIAVCLLGHSHPALTRAIAEQAGRLVHVSNLYYNEPNVRLAAELTRHTAPLARVFFCNSGAEANEAAIKLARRTAVTVRGETERTELVAMLGSFHGRSIATVSLTGQEKYRKGFGPLLPGVSFAPYGDRDAVARLVTRRTCAVIAEPIQGEGGLVEAPAGFLAFLRELTRERGALLVFDEVQTGMGRTGTFLAHQRDGVVPDVCTLAKGIAGGVPMGAMLCTDDVAGGFVPGSHASTFGGNPLASAAALAVLRLLDEEQLVDRARRVGEGLAARLGDLIGRHPNRALEVRGRGLLRGLRLAGEAAPIVAACRERGLLVSAAGGDVVRFAPSLLVSEAECEQAVDLLGAALAAG